MKTQYYKAGTASIGLALACALGLAACGGGEEQFPDQIVSVTLINVTQPGLKLKLNGGAPAEVDHTKGFFSFSPGITANTAYKVELASATDIPPNATKCEVLRGTGNVGINPPSDIVVLCTLITYKLGGSITGNFTGEMIINNGSATTTVQTGATAFELPPVPEAVPYSVTLLKTPTTGTCTVSPARPASPAMPAVGDTPAEPAKSAYAAPIGTMPKGDLTNLNINCN